MTGRSGIGKGIVVGGLFFMFAMMSSLGSNASAEEIKWHNNYAKALREAEESNRPLLVQVSATWCSYCTTMKRETLADKKVVDEVAENFVALKLDADRDSELVQKFGVRSYPTTIIVAPDRSILKRVGGYQAAGPFLTSLRNVIKINK